MNFELEQNRVLLSTLSAGTGIDLKVGGTLAAQTGSKEADGNLQADRMTEDGVIKGTDRQQVSVTHTDNKAGTTVNGPTSQVLGNLAAQGIRSGANDSLSPGAVKSGQDAVNALLNSGLLTVKNSPGVQAALAAPTPNGAATTYTDASGKVSLTVAGQAKVQEVYNQLKLTETFDVKHFADQQTAQIVTLIAAVALTICSGGAGAGLIGAAAGSMQATVANAVFVSMMSTMTGQLAGGASFSDAFQSGVKAGAASALTAGVTYGVSDSLGLNPQYDSAGSLAKDGQGNIVYQTSSGAEYAKLSALDKFGDSRFWALSAAKSISSGAAAAANGGDFRLAAGMAMVTHTASMVYQSTVGYEPSPGPGRNPENPFYTPVTEGSSSSPEYGRQPASTFPNNVIGINEQGYFCSQGTICSKALNLTPFINATGGFHDYIFNHNWLPMNPLTNVGSMMPAAVISIPASLDSPVYNWQLAPKKDEKK